MNLLELKTLAEKATPGPWKCEIGQRAWRLFCHGKTAYGKHFEEYNGAWALLDQVDSINGTKEFQQNNAQFIAAANPQTILKLIEAIESAKLHLACITGSFGMEPVSCSYANKGLQRIKEILGE